MEDLWNGMFDVNGDGLTDIGEEYTAYRMFEAVTGEPEDDDEEDEDEYMEEDPEQEDWDEEDGLQVLK